MGIKYKRANKDFFPGFEGYLTGNEVVLVCVENYIPKRQLDTFYFFRKKNESDDKILNEYENSKTPLLRISLNGEPDFTGLKKNLRNIYLKGVKEIM
ncbi:hypothetical protein [Okeania sp. KiyG1]|uniref:hypothetical protein n=1 Tax=Okeania sp. KiyG1 TaxID=2720165 RepID=UPI0019235B5B|nr:hypothetical protein [Okeania sp. KiyG1]GGA46296.1 hypothetical protein CYANOKiyG1_65310 [Okeania sp. KiyG1]